MINLNKIKLGELLKIRGIGKITATRIVKYREENNGFKKLLELKKIRGIAENTYQNLKKQFILTDNKEEKEKKFKVKLDVKKLQMTNPEEIHLVGDMTNWDPKDKTYSLIEKENGIWFNEFNLKEGTEYKIMYDSTDWNDNQYFGDNGSNLVVEF